MFKKHVLAASLGLLVPLTAFADIRPFSFVKDVYPLGKGGIEYEQYHTWSFQTEGDNAFHELQFKHELAFGVADNFDLAVYLPVWSYTHSKDGDVTKFEQVAVEGVVYLSSPVSDPIGVGLYAEAGAGEDSLAFEFKLLLQKDIDNWVFAYNLVLETEVEGVFDETTENETEGVIENVFGAAYHLNDQLRVGGEGVIATEFPDWEEAEETSVYLGPMVGYDTELGNLMLNFVLTPLIQVTDVEEAARFKTRLLLEVEF